MRKAKPIFARNEFFGKTVYDPNTFEYSFISDSEYEKIRNDFEAIELNNDCSNVESGILFSPIRIYYDLTSQCNLTCKTCLNRSGSAKADELNMEESIRIVEGIHRDAVFEIRFSGGEPTMKYGWDSIMARSRALGLVTSLNSNGVYDKKTIDKLINIHPEEITISLDGCREVNDYIRGEGTYQKSIDSIKKLSISECRVTINTVITAALREHDVRELLEITNKYCADISFFHVRPFGRAAYHKDLHLDFSALCDYNDMIERIKSDYPEACVRIRSSSLRKNSIDNSASTTHGLLAGGADGFTRLNIMPNGEIYAGGCVPFVDSVFGRQLLLGNIIHEGYSVLDVWRKNLKLNYIREFSCKLASKCRMCSEYARKCSGFTLEMELYGSINPKGNTYCKYWRG
jgi:MoaA/NifB/PqqE/SkfB family radical SAM enzyme